MKQREKSQASIETNNDDSNDKNYSESEAEPSAESEESGIPEVLKYFPAKIRRLIVQTTRIFSVFTHCRQVLYVI